MKKILVIEDNEINQDLLVRRLKKKGYEVESAFDGESGLQKITSSQPDLVLLDMNLPKMDGWQVATACKKSDLTKHIPIIALTAHAMQGDREKALAAGCDDYEAKPIAFDELMKKIAKYVA